MLALDDRRTALIGGLLVVALVGTALAFPNTGAAGAALLALVAGAGGAIAGLSPRLRVSPPGWLQDLAIVALLASLSVHLFSQPWNHSSYRIFDWGPHHANLRHLIDGLREGRVPAWVMGVSTGDSPYELYAFLPYYLAAKAAILTGESHLTLLMVRSGIVVHTLAALSGALLARRVLSWPWALALGFAMLYDIGSVWGGGAEGALNLGVTHSALANAIWPFVLIAVLRALRRPHWMVSVRIWALVALAVACHPLALVSGLATIAALVVVALLTRDVPPHRAAIAALHVAIGCALVAAVWMPFGARLVLYGVHFAEAGRLSWRQFGHMLAEALPETSFPPLVFAGYLGLVTGMLSRRAAPTLLAVFAGTLMAGLYDQLYTLLDLMPTLETVRFQTVRLASAAKVGVYISGAHLVERALAAARPVFRDRQRYVAGALLALACVGVLRGAVPYFDRFRYDLRELAEHDLPDQRGLGALASWAREQNEAMRPEAYGRLLHEDDRRTYLIYHVNAESRLPTLWVGPVSALFLRERIENASPESLRRFNVRWVMRADRPPSLGDPATERRFGRYIVRELPGWDGQFARVERGNGRAIVTRLDDERVDVELLDTSEPALVALGMGYYPRWQVLHDERGALPVYALPGIEGGQLNVVAAWLPPGHSVFRPNGSLPTDGKGTGVSIAAGLAALAILAIWTRAPRLRARLNFGLARTIRELRRRRRALALAALSLMVLGLGLASLRASRAPVRALQLGNGARASAVVEARSDDGPFRRCPYMPAQGVYRCAGAAFIQDTTANLLNDAPPSPPFAVPAINLAPASSALEVRISLRARLEGEYWAVTNGPGVRLEVEGEADSTLSNRQIRRAFAPAEAEREIRLTATAAPRQFLQLAMVQRTALDPPRDYPVAPEHSPFD
jgi:hypothetical protein